MTLAVFPLLLHRRTLWDKLVTAGKQALTATTIADKVASTLAALNPHMAVMERVFAEPSVESLLQLVQDECIFNGLVQAIHSVKALKSMPSAVEGGPKCLAELAQLTEPLEKVMRQFGKELFLELFFNDTKHVQNIWETPVKFNSLNAGTVDRLSKLLLETKATLLQHYCPNILRA
jgi:hypothetical protein